MNEKRKKNRKNTKAIKMCANYIQWMKMNDVYAHISLEGVKLDLKRAARKFLLSFSHKHKNWSKINCKSQSERLLKATMRRKCFLFFCCRTFLRNQLTFEGNHECFQQIDIRLNWLLVFMCFNQQTKRTLQMKLQFVALTRVIETIGIFCDGFEMCINEMILLDTGVVRLWQL